MWCKGYYHYHTSFHYPKSMRISPDELAMDLRETGAVFTFCAGDHGKQGGHYYWGMDIREYQDYKEECLSVRSKKNVAVLIPAPEIHMMFPPFNERHEHHTCIPIYDYIPALYPPKTRETALSYTDRVDEFLKECHAHGISVALNHPYGSTVVPLFSGPPPLDTPSLYAMDYLELFTIDGLEWFLPNFQIYTGFLSSPLSYGMACCGGVDNCESPFLLLSQETRLYGSTYLFIEGEVSVESVLQAWNERRSCAVYGNLAIVTLNPIPCRNLYRTDNSPFLHIGVRSDSGEEITGVEVYRNGTLLFNREYRGLKECEFFWSDESPLIGENCYVIHVKGKREHLITSPIRFLYGG